MSSDWQPIETAPWQTVIEVRNPQMQDETVLATRGYTHNGMVHPNDTFCTTAGKLCCPTEWRLPDQVSA